MSDASTVKRPWRDTTLKYENVIDLTSDDNERPLKRYRAHTDQPSLSRSFSSAEAHIRRPTSTLPLPAANSSTPSTHERRSTDDISAWTTRISIPISDDLKVAKSIVSRNFANVDTALKNEESGDSILGSQRLPIDISNDESETSSVEPSVHSKTIRKQAPTSSDGLISIRPRFRETAFDTSLVSPSGQDSSRIQFSTSTSQEHSSQSKFATTFKSIALKANNDKPSRVSTSIQQYTTVQPRLTASKPESKRFETQTTLTKSPTSTSSSIHKDGHRQPETVPVTRPDGINTHILPLRSGSSPRPQLHIPPLVLHNEFTNRASESRRPVRATRLKEPVIAPAEDSFDCQKSLTQSNGPVKSSLSSNTKAADTTASSTPTYKLVSIDVPLTPSQKEQQRQEWVKRLKADTAVIHQYADVIHDADMLGLTGFCTTTYPVDDRPRPESSATKRRRHALVRADISLDRTIIDLDRMRQGLHPRDAELRLVHPRKQVEKMLTGRFKKIVPPLTFAENDQHKYIDDKFQFVSRYIYRDGVSSARQKRKLNKNVTLCDCVGGICGLLCSCVQAPRVADATEGTQRIQTYQRNQQGQIVLTDEFLDTWHPKKDWSRRCEILECSEHCICGPRCLNRVVQQGRTVPLQIFLTQHCGFGIRPSCDIVRGQFIDTYLGEVLTAAELKKREDALELDQPSYSFELDWFVQEESQKWHIDGRNFGSPMRFVNHSCEPNTQVITVASLTGEKQLHYLAFFATKDIPAGEEVLIDYDPSLALQAPLGSQGVAELPPEVTRCMCGSPNCRGRVWREEQERRTRRHLGPSRL